MAGHAPVLLDEVVEAAAPLEGALVVDATFGAGGYASAFLRAGASVVAFDRDPAAIAGGASLKADAAGRLTLVEAPFDQLDTAFPDTGPEAADAVVFDFGVSSMQLDQGERGFSFRLDGPLDMRMGTDGTPVADFINEAGEDDIADVLYQYGEERRSRAIARAIATERSAHPFTTTLQLSVLAERILGRGKPGAIHPATRMFQALRIFINDELGQIVRALIAAERRLVAGGRLVAVSFHSLEDRIVKRFLSEASGRAQATSRHLPVAEGPEATFAAGGKVTAPTAEERARNPRARSAKLRRAVRTAAVPSDWPQSRLQGLGLPPLVFSSLQREWAGARS